MLICGANDVIGVGQYGYTAVYSGAGVLQAVLGYCSGTGTAGTGLQVLVLLVLSVYTAVLLATCIHPVTSSVGFGCVHSYVYSAPRAI